MLEWVRWIEEKFVASVAFVLAWVLVVLFGLVLCGGYFCCWLFDKAFPARRNEDLK